MDTTKERAPVVPTKVHPAIAALESASELAAMIEGYLGSEVEGTVRIYPALDTSAYVEFPKSSVLHLESAEGESPGRVRAFLSSAQRVSVVQRRFTLAGQAGRELGDLTTQRPSRNLIHPFWACAKQCEGGFAVRASTALSTEMRAFREKRPEARGALQDLAESLKSEADSLLYACLSECEANHGVPQTMNGSGLVLVPGIGPRNEPYSIGRVHQRLVQKYRLYGDAS
jgi:hypothetical protein